MAAADEDPTLRAMADNPDKPSEPTAFSDFPQAA